MANVFRRYDLELDGVRYEGGNVVHPYTEYLGLTFVSYSPSDIRWKECYMPNYAGPKLNVTVFPRTA